MYGYSVNTVQYWMVESLLTLLIGIAMLLGIIFKQRWAALAFPAGRLLIRIGWLIFQPSDTCYALSLDKTALLLFLSILCLVMYRFAAFGYVTAITAVWTLSVLWQESFDGITTYFLFGGELTYLGIECVATVAVYLLLVATGVLIGERRRFPPYRPVFKQ